MITYKTALELAGISATVTETPAGFRIELARDTTEEDQQVALELATSVYDFALDRSPEEAAANANVFSLVTKDSPRYAELAADANESSLDDDEAFEPEEEEDEEAPEGEEDEGEEEELEDEEDEEDLEDRDLKVLIGPEHHKMATKLYVGLCNNQNLARFPAFTIDLDQFLQRYYVRPPAGAGFDGEADFETESASADGAKECACGICEACIEDQVKDSLIEEVATMVAAELAKGKKKQKKGRSGFLSMLMKAISGDQGDAIIKAWENGEKDELKELMGEVNDKLIVAKD